MWQERELRQKKAQVISSMGSSSPEQRILSECAGLFEIGIEGHTQCLQVMLTLVSGDEVLEVDTDMDIQMSYR